MKKLFILLPLLWASVCAATQTNYIFGYVGDYSLVGQKKIQITATLLSPNPRYIGNVLVRQEPQSVYSDTNGLFGLTNYPWGFYRLDIFGAVGTTFKFNVWTNTLGSTPIGTLITNNAALPPNPGTNYYTQAQEDAWRANIMGSSNTNIVWGTQTNSTAGRAAWIYYYFPTNSYNSTNYPYGILHIN